MTGSLRVLFLKANIRGHMRGGSGLIPIAPRPRRLAQRPRLRTSQACSADTIMDSLP